MLTCSPSRITLLPISRMSRTLIICLFIFGCLISACHSRTFETKAISLHDGLSPGDTYQGIRLLGALRLNTPEIDGLRFCGLSGLAWDDDAGLLYTISDKGSLFHLKPVFDTSGHLSDLQAVAAYPLRDAAGRPLPRPLNDSEGLAIAYGDNNVQGDSQLFISFEGKPRVVRYTVDGRWQGEQPLAKTVRNVSNFRHSNQSLEAVALDPQWGILTAPEMALRNDPPELIRIFSSKNQFWLYPLGKAPGSALVAMERLPDGRLLTLERAFVSPLQPFAISLRLTQLSKPPTSSPLSVKDVAIFQSDQGWFLDNFEGLTRQQALRFFMISDDNCSSLQSTLLVYFELLQHPVTP